MGDLDVHFQCHLAILDLEFCHLDSCNAITRKYFTQPNEICREYASNRASNLIELWVTLTYIFKVTWQCRA